MSGYKYKRIFQHGYAERWDGLYERLERLEYHSPRYDKTVIVEAGTVRDGASGAFDIDSNSWWVHDQLCHDNVWFDGTDVTPTQAAAVVGDILADEGRWFRRLTWPVATYLFGCKHAWDN